MKRCPRCRDEKPPSARPGIAGRVGWSMGEVAGGSSGRWGGVWARVAGEEEGRGAGRGRVGYPGGQRRGVEAEEERGGGNDDVV